MVPSPSHRKLLHLNNIYDRKQKLREEFRQRRNAFVDQLDNATRNLAFRTPPSPMAKLIDSSEVMAVYASQTSEAPTNRLIEHITNLGKTVSFPIVKGNSPMEFRAVSSIDLLEAGFKGIGEPTKNCPIVIPDIIIVPLIAFDRSMNRLGQGGGHYDRTFAKYPEALRIGLAWSVQETSEVPIEEHDVTLHAIVTESEIIQKVNVTP